MKKRVLLSLLVLLLLGVTAVAYSMACYRQPSDVSEAKTVVIPAGSGAQALLNQLHAEGLLPRFELVAQRRERALLVALRAEVFGQRPEPVARRVFAPKAIVVFLGALHRREGQREEARGEDESAHQRFKPRAWERSMRPR